MSAPLSLVGVLCHPVLVERADCVRGFLWKVEHEGDLGSTLATDLGVSRAV